MKKLMIGVICFISLAAVGLLVYMGLVIGKVAPSFGAGGLFSEPPLVNRQVFEASAFSEISLGYHSESITLLPSAGGEVVLEEYMSRWDESMLARVSAAAGSLSIRSGERPMLRIFPSWRCKVKLYVPAQWLGALSLETTSGGLHSEHDFSFGSFSAKTSSGGIRLGGITAREGISLAATSGGIGCEGLTAGGEVTLKAASGGIRLGAVKAEAPRAESTSGGMHFDSASAREITAENTSGGLRFGRIEGAFRLRNSSGGVSVDGGAGQGSVQTTSGGIRLTLEELQGDLAMEAGSGTVRLYLPAHSAFAFEAETGSGSIRAPEDGGLSYNEKGNEAAGSFGENPEHKVEMRATSGGVRLEWV